jgi:hypothetical protein
MSGERGNGQARGRRSATRRLGCGCLALLLFLCSGLSILAVALQSGPLTVGLPGNTSLLVGSENFVLSNYSFQNGTSYFLDVNGSGVRNILQVNYLSDNRHLELVIHHSTKEVQVEQHLVDLHVP